MNIDIVQLSQWIGRTQTTSECLTAFPSNALAATLDRSDPPYVVGSALPPLWHWLHFLPLHPMSEIGPDGHANTGGFLPPVPLPHRMWAGSRLAFLAPIRIGDDIRRVSTIQSIEHKRGRSGDLVFVTVRHELSGPSGPAIEEEHDIVYREPMSQQKEARSPVIAPTGAAWQRAIRPDPVLLFRYSALTFNSHRIHYDHEYAMGVEGYPGLVVHGPLIATLLLDGLARAEPGARVRRFAFRAVAPVFHIDTFEVCGKRASDGKVVLWARKPSGALCMEATAEIA